MLEYRTQFWNKNTSLPEEEAKKGNYYIVEIDSEERMVKYSYYNQENLESYVKYRYRRLGTTEITERVFFDNKDTFQGKQVVRESPGVEELVEIYDMNGDLINLLRGTFEYIIKKGEIA